MKKVRESGMPDETWWESFFEPKKIFAKLGLTSHCRNAVEFGCGYGTFTLPAAEIVQGMVYAFDIEPEMVEITQKKAQKQGLHNIHVELRDFMENGTGLPDESVDYVMVFNILHTEDPEILLRESWRILTLEGKLGIFHWNDDPSTPRGPSMDIRPKPEHCRSWAEAVGFISQTEDPIDLPPYHYGWLLRKL